MTEILYLRQYAGSSSDSTGLSDGGVTVYQILPARPHLRLRALIHHEVTLQKGFFKLADLKPMTRWDEVWNVTGDWCEGYPFVSKHRGRVSSGLMAIDGNGLRAFVIDMKGIYWDICGSWS